jgi:YfiH family protein
MFLHSPLLEAAGFRHAFFTRHGGVSEGPFASLNFSSALGDSPDNVLENLSRAAVALGVEREHVYFLDQVHGTDVHRVDSSTPRDEVLRRTGDALVSSDPAVACGVRTADCVPVLLACPATGLAGAAHAGWRGAVAGVVPETVAALRRAGAVGPLLAAIGPHISVDAFEVSEEVAEQIQRAAPDISLIDRTRGPRPHANLRALVRAQLLEHGVERIDDVAGCTVGDRDSFFSYRRDGKIGGRHLSAIVPQRR